MATSALNSSVSLLQCSRLSVSSSSPVQFRVQSLSSFVSSKHSAQSSRTAPVSALLSTGNLDGAWDDEEPLDPEAVREAYENLYGESVRQVYSGEGNKVKVKSAADDDGAVAGLKKGKRGKKSSEDDDSPSDSRRQRDEFEDRLVEVRRVTKVVKGGKQLSFRAVVIVGDKKGRVGVGVAKAKEVVIAVQKAGLDARRHLVRVPLTKDLTFPHRADGFFGAAQVMLRPAAIGTGVIAGGAVRVALELAGIENALGKQLGSGNALNNARAVLDAVSNMKQIEEVSKMRGIPVEELWK